jgi:hypothetical protein
MNHSNELGNLATALAIVQGALKPAVKDEKNAFFKNVYAGLGSVWDSCRQLLSENGLSVTQLNLPAENGVIVETVLLHKSGEWISGQIFLPLTKQDPQAVGSATTYGRRYGLSAIIGIVADADDDAESAQGRRPASSVPARAVPMSDSNGAPQSAQIATLKRLIADKKLPTNTVDFSKLTYATAEAKIAELSK